MKKIDTNHIETRVKQGYFSVHNKKPTNKQLNSLNKKQIKKYYSKGKSKVEKAKSRKKIVVMLFLVTLCAILASIVGIRHLYNVKYENMNSEVTDLAHSYFYSAQYKECFIPYENTYNAGEQPKEYYESVSRGLVDCEKYKSTSNTLTTSSQQSAPQSQSSVNTNQSSSPDLYSPPNCVTTVLSYQTTYENANYIDNGKTEVQGGIDGFKVVCTADSNGFTPTDRFVPPYNKVIYTGTRAPLPAYKPPSNNPTNQQANQMCAQYGASSAYTSCMRAYGY
jgi:hypothetical protein